MRGNSIMSAFYEYDYVSEDVLIRQLDGETTPEILHKGDTKWEYLRPRPDYKDESYCRAVYLGQGCWEDLKTINQDEADKILKQWGYTEDPPKAK